MARPDQNEIDRDNARAATARGPSEPDSVADPDRAQKRRPWTADNMSGSARVGVETPRSGRGRRMLILAVAAVAAVLLILWLVPALVSESQPVLGNEGLIADPAAEVSIVGDGS
jgi:hypothetical protein